MEIPGTYSFIETFQQYCSANDADKVSFAYNTSCKLLRKIDIQIKANERGTFLQLSVL